MELRHALALEKIIEKTDSLDLDAGSLDAVDAVDAVDAAVLLNE